MNHIVGIGDFKVASEVGDVIKTFALGSCVAVVVFCPESPIVGMAHIALPKSEVDPERANRQPAYYADTGIPTLIKSMRLVGCTCPLRNLKAKISGGATVIHFTNNMFNIGERNINEVRNILNKVRIQILAEDVGGNISRTVSVVAGERKITLLNPAIGSWQI